MAASKVCTGCKKRKSVEEFSWRIKCKNVREPRCKSCDAVRRREWYRRCKVRDREYPATLRKECQACFKKKPLNEFPVLPLGRYGRGVRCKPCVAVRNQERYRRYKARDREYPATLRKECLTCLEKKPLSEFGKFPLGRYGRRGRCKKCAARQFRARYRTDPELRAKRAEYSRLGPESKRVKAEPGQESILLAFARHDR